MKRALLYFLLYRMLDLESLLWGITESVRQQRMKVSITLNKINHGE